MDSSASANRPPIPAFNAPREDPSNASTPGSATEESESCLDSQHQPRKEGIGNDSLEETGRRSLDFGLGNSGDHEEKDADDASISEAFDYDDRSVSTSSSGSSFGSEESLTLQERAARSQKRNALFLQALDEKYKYQLPANLQGAGKSKKKTKSDLSSDEGVLVGSSIPRGMLRPRNKRYLRHRKPIAPENSGGGQQWPLTTHSMSFGQKLQDLMERYPHRKLQIRQLAAILHGTIHAAGLAKSRASSNTSISPPMPVHVPPPIFLSGPIGSGKTSIVKEVLELLDSSTSENKDKGEPIWITNSSTESTKSDVQSNPQEQTHCSTAYINCATIEPSSIERLVLCAYEQLCPSTEITEASSEQHRRFKRRSSKSEDDPLQHDYAKRAKENISTNTPSTNLQDLNEKSERKCEKQDEPEPAPTKGQKTRNESIQEEEPTSLVPKTEKINPQKDVTDKDARPLSRVQPIRISKSLGVLRQENNTASTIPQSNSHDHKIGKASKLSQKKSADSVETFHSAIMAFGRILQPIFGEGSLRAGILVLDHGERLLSFSARKRQYEKTNCLAELLLLPKILASPFKLDMIVGYKHRIQSTQDKFMGKVVNAFLNTLIQVLSDSTRDINQYLRIGRSLWPMFLRPLSSEQICATLDAARASIAETQVAESPNEKLDKAILALLGKSLLGQIGRMAGDLSELLLGSSCNHRQEGRANGLNSQASPDIGPRQPFLRTCLLLAAFICQNNRADQDKKVFSAHGNGKRKRRQGNNSQDGDEEIAFGSSSGTLEKVKSLRPRPFLVERVFSIFVTLVRLNPDRPTQILGRMQQDYAVNELGSTSLYRDLHQLVELGYLHPVSHNGEIRGEQTNLNGAKFWCSLSMEEATNVAKENGIPLENYLV